MPISSLIFLDSEEQVIHFLTLDYLLPMSNKNERHASSLLHQARFTAGEVRELATLGHQFCNFL